MSIVAKKILMGSGAVATPSDDEFNRVNFLSHFDGANNGVNNVFDDGSASNHTMTASGNVTQGSFGPFARPDGEWGVSFDGTGDYLTLPTTLTRLTIANKDSQAATFEAFVFVKGYTANSSDDYKNASIYSKGDVYLNFAITPEGYAEFYHYDGSVRILTTSATVPLSTWTHVAVTIAGGVTKIYIGGVLRATGTWYGINATGLTEASRIGLNPASGSVALNAIVSNLRLVEGTAVYTGNFTPPTSKLTAITNTKLLTCQSNSFIDNSSDGLAVTPAGDNVAVTAFGPFLTDAVYDPAVNGASAYFDGSGDYLNCTVNSDFSFGTADFSVEYYAYITGGDKVAFGAHQQGSADGYYSYAGTPRIEVYSNGAGGTGLTSGQTMPKNSWYHVVISRQSGRLRIFIDGVMKNYTDTVFTINNDNRMFVVGGITSGVEAFPGYITELRVVKGSCAAAYQTSSTTNGAVIFTPPTAPITAVTNTKLLLNMADGQAIDSAAQNNLTLYGTAKTSTAQKKFGTASLLLDGNSDYAIFPNGATGGAGDWTIEMFIFSSNVNSGEFGTILDNRPDSTNGLYQTLVLAAATLKFATAGAYKITSGDALSVNTWYHVALCKAGSSTKMFIDGTQTGSTYTDNNTYINTVRTQLGAEVSFGSGVAEFFNGYIDDFRISNMARYTSNFTAPSEPFADKGQDA